MPSLLGRAQQHRCVADRRGLGSLASKVAEVRDSMPFERGDVGSQRPGPRALTHASPHHRRQKGGYACLVVILVGFVLAREIPERQ